MARVKFTRNYDFTWPSGCVTAFRENWEGPVKQEVAAAAVAAGAARRVKLETETVASGKPKRKRRTRKTVGIRGGKIDQAKPTETLAHNLPADLAEPQALTPNLHEGGGENSSVDERADSQ